MTSLDLNPPPSDCGMSFSLRNPLPRSTHVVEADEDDADDDEYKYSLHVICITLDSSSSPVRTSVDIAEEEDELLEVPAAP